MKLVIPYLNEQDLGATPHSTITTSNSRVVALHKTEYGSWLNGSWNGKGTYRYEVMLEGKISYAITKDTYEMLEKAVYGE